MVGKPNILGTLERAGKVVSAVRMKRYLALLLVAVMCLGLTGCGGKKSASQTEELDATEVSWQGEDLYPHLGRYVMEVGHVQSEDNPRHISLLQFKKDVENATCGHVQVVVRANGELGSEDEMLQKTMAGTIQGMRGGQFPYTPRLLMFTLPFLTQTRAQTTAMFHSELAQEVCQEAGEQTGTVLLALCDAGGYRQLSNNVRPIHTPEDVRGLTLRTNGIQTSDMTFQALGAQTVSIPYGNLYAALSSGVVDGQDNPWINSKEQKFYEVQPYFTELNIQIHPDPFFVNGDWFNSLPEEFQDALRRCAADMGDYNDQLIEENNQAAKEAIDAIDGVEVYTPTEEEMAAFRAAVQPVYQQFVTQGICTQEELTQILEIVK